MRRARQGDAEAYGELARRHQRAALRLAAVVLGTPQGAEDVVQQALVRAWRAIGRFDDSRAFRPWLLRIVANAARNDRRARGRAARLAVRAAGQAPGANGSRGLDPEDAVVGDVDRRRVVAALNRLGAEDRLVVALRHFDQLTEREMADVLGVPGGTVKSRLSRAMGRLRAELVQEYGSDNDGEADNDGEDEEVGRRG